MFLPVTLAYSQFQSLAHTWARRDGTIAWATCSAVHRTQGWTRAFWALRWGLGWTPADVQKTGPASTEGAGDHGASARRVTLRLRPWSLLLLGDTSGRAKFQHAAYLRGKPTHARPRAPIKGSHLRVLKMAPSPTLWHVQTCSLCDITQAKAWLFQALKAKVLGGIWKTN